MSGHVILLNGAPSSGKSTVGRALQLVLQPPHWYMSLDDLRAGYRHSSLIHPELLVAGFVDAVAAMARAGHEVITEAIVLPDWVVDYQLALANLTVYFVGVRCPLDVAERREAARADRLPQPLRVPDFQLVHDGREYDVEFDTSLVSATEAAQLVRARLEDPARPTAFSRLVSSS